MSRRESFIRYRLIIQKLKRSYYTFSELSRYLQQESEIQGYNLNISLRTFQRDVNEILSIYNIEIKYSKTKQAYYIEEYGREDFNERIFEAFDTFNALNITNRLADYIQLEKRKSIGTEHLYGILHGIKNSVSIKFAYQKYWEGENSERIVQPYALKEFRNRWYVLGKDLKDDIFKTFALDRLTHLEITKLPFKKDIAIDIASYFKNSFGVVVPNIKEQAAPQEVILRFNAFQGKYIKSLPLHHTQNPIIDNEDELVVKLDVFLTHDLFMEILSYGSNVQVLKPESLAKQVKEELIKSLKKIKNEY